jgi:3-hydroxyacyl-CoA dehydrogenase/enoyl-CoA hydratase/3-hydroxybutyryl-CoA epimerase
MSGFRHISLVRTKNDIIWLTINSQDNEKNALTVSLLKEMIEVVTGLHGKGFKGLVISSAKLNHFIAGTDLDTLLKLTSEQKAEIYTGLGNQLCRHISHLDCASIALINGHCCNSGLEIALSCDYRIAADNPNIQFSYADIQQGHYAGFGSITRMIERKGLLNSLEILNKGHYSAKEFLSLGLIDYIIATHKTHQASEYLIEQAHKKSNHHSSFRFKPKVLFKKLLPQKLKAYFISSKYKKSGLNSGKITAINSIIETWKTWHVSPDANHNEAIVAAKLLSSDAVKKHLKLQKLYQKLGQNITPIKPSSKRIHIIGCGIMGCYIARLCAENNFQVSIYDSRHAVLENLLPDLYQTLKNTYNKHQQQAIVDRIIIDIDNIGLIHADIIIEATSEDKHAKASLLHDIDKQAKNEAYILTTTASLSLENISKGMQRPQRLASFNPYHPLFNSKIVEISINTRGDHLIEAIKAFATTLQLKPVEIKSNSGYLGTRLLMTYLTESMLIHQSGISLQAIDQLTADMGMRHAPFDIIDSIGINECLQVIETLADHLDYDVPSILMQKNQLGLKGKKSGAGFYRYKKGKKQRPLLDKTLNSPSWKTKRQEVEKRLIEKIINEARSCLQKEMVNDQEIIDLIAIVIIGFSVEKGGPLAYLQQLQVQQSQKLQPSKKELPQE